MPRPRSGRPDGCARCPARRAWPCGHVGLAAWTWVVLQAIAGGQSDAEVASLILWVFGWVGLALVSALARARLDLAGPRSPPCTTCVTALLATWRGGRSGRVPGLAPPKTTHRPAVRPAARLAERPGRLAGRGFPGRLRLAGAGRPCERRSRAGPGARRVHARDAGAAWPGSAAIPGASRPRSSASGSACSVAWRPTGSRVRPTEGRLRRRGFGSALARSPWDDALLALVAVAAGSVIWDGISQTQPWTDLVGSPGLLAGDLLLARFLAGVVAWLRPASSRRAVGLAAMGAGLVPVTTGYLVAHYLGFLLVEGQRIVVAALGPAAAGLGPLRHRHLGAPRRLAGDLALWTDPGRRRSCWGTSRAPGWGTARCATSVASGPAGQPVAPGRADGRADRAGALVAGPEPRLLSGRWSRRRRVRRAAWGA